jgi:hypothetical protein
MLEEGAAESLTYVTSLAVWPTNHCPDAQFASTTSNLQRPTLPRTPLQMSPPMSPEPVILQIQDNGNDLEEEGGDDFVEIDDIVGSQWGTTTVELATTATATAATTVTMTATATTAAMARTVAATAATIQPRKRGRPKGSKDKELRKRRQKATGGGDTTATGN